MDWLKDKAQIESRSDGTFVVMAHINGEWMPYHVTPLTASFTPNTTLTKSASLKSVIFI